MNPNEIVVREVQGVGRLKILQFFAESVGQARQPAHIRSLPGDCRQSLSSVSANEVAASRFVC